MIVGIPTEVKDRENRVSITPGGVTELAAHGHRVLVEAGAGEGSGFLDDAYLQAGAEIIPSHAAVFDQSDLIVKVKEPISAEYNLLREHQLLFTYLHLAADEGLTRFLMERKVQAIAYETVQLPNRSLPLLTPMSEVAGRMSVQVGAHYLQSNEGGYGVLLGGVAGVEAARVVVIGGGVVGTNAAQIALGMGASVSIVDLDVDRLRHLELLLHGRLTTLVSNRTSIGDAVAEADLVIGGVLLPGARAPKLVTTAMIERMRTGSVVVDVAIDQGGCIETAKPTTHSKPTYEVSGVIHYCVTNMPGAVPRTSTIALSNATLPYVLALADNGLAAAAAADPALALGINVLNGHIVYQAVAEAFDLPYSPWQSVA